MKKSKNEIINAIRSGNDSAALKFLYQNVYPKVEKYIRANSGNQEDSEDIFQEAVLVFYKQVIDNKYDRIEDITGFICTVARNIWINKAKKNRKLGFTEVVEEVAEEENQLVKMIMSEKWAAFERLFDMLGEKCKQLLIYSVYEKLSMEEIADKMGLSNANAAKTQNYRCKQKMIELVNENKELSYLLQS